MKLFKLAQKYGSRAAQAATGLMISGAALAQTTPTYETFDASPAAADILGLVAGLLLIGGAVFAIHLAVKSTKWGRKAL